jgi:antitoxin component YwqK of YwqJK toxin-antitoxin module
MQRQLLLILTFLPTILFAQLTETIVTDTNFVRQFKSSTLSDDTTIYLTNNRPIGKWIVYFDLEKRNKALEREYPTGQEDIFTETSWFKTGNIKSTKILNKNKDSLLSSYYYPNGKMRNRTIEYYKVTRNQWILIRDDSYYDNGQIKRTPIDWTSLEKQHITEFFESGKKQREFNWVNGTLIGEFKEYFENGKLKMKGNYMNPTDLDPTLVPSARPSLEIGDWKYYNEKGKLIKEELYENGKLIKTTEK